MPRTRGVDGAAGVDAGVVLVGRHEIVHEGLVAADVPEGEDEVALDPLRPRRRRRQLSRRDALRPVGVHVERRVHALNPEHVVHLVAAHSGAQPPLPGFLVGGELRLGLEHMIDGAGLAASELVAEVAVRLQRVEPVGLGQHAGSHAVAVVAGTGEEALVRRRHQGQPVIAGIDLRGFLRSRGVGCLERDRIGRGPHLERLGVDEPIPPHPHGVARIGQFRQHEPAVVVGDDDLHELRRQVFRLGDHPDAGFGALGALDDTGDVALGCREPGCGDGFGRRTGNRQKNARGDHELDQPGGGHGNTLASSGPVASAADRRDVGLGVGG